MAFPISEIRDLRQQRVQELTENNTLVDQAEKEGRNLTDDEQATFDKRFKKADELRQRYERMEQMNEAERATGEMIGPDASPIDPEDRSASGTPPSSSNRSSGRVVEFRDGRHYADVRTRFVDHLNDPNQPEVSEEERSALALHEAAFRKILSKQRNKLTDAERRTVQLAIDSDGGILVAPITVASTMIEQLSKRVAVRRLAFQQSVTSSESLGVVRKLQTTDEAEWTPEIPEDEIGQGDTVKYEGRELKPHELAKYGRATRKAERMTSGMATNLVMRDLDHKFARTEDNAFQHGDGDNKPLGVFVPSPKGISTDRDREIPMVGEVEGTVFYDALKGAKWALREEYHPGASWLASSQFFERVSYARYPDGRPIWVQSDRPNTPDRLLTFNSAVSDFSPTDFSGGKYVAILGNFGVGYWVVDNLRMEFQVLREIGSLKNLLIVVARKETDGMPVDEDAFIRLKVAA